MRAQTERTYPLRSDQPHEEEAEREIQHTKRKVDAHGRPPILSGELLQPLTYRQTLLGPLCSITPPRREYKVASLCPSREAVSYPGSWSHWSAVAHRSSQGRERL